MVGWKSSSYLSTGRSQAGLEPDTVWDRFDVQTDQEVREAGGRLMSVNTEWLQIRDGPTHDYAAPEAIQWGQVVRWTGNSIEEGGHTWYEVIYDDDTRGWARADRIEDFVQKAGAPPTEDGKESIQVQQERSFSQYNLYNVDSYCTSKNDFAAPEPIQWKHDIGPQGVNGPIEVPYGALFGPDGVAMQGSGVVTVEVIDPATGESHGQPVYFTLDNPRDLTWANSNGDHTQWGEGGWTNDRPAEIANPEDAHFRPLPAPPDLTSQVSLAGPPEYRGQTIWVPGLEGTLDNNPRALFKVEDAGGAFPSGSLRFDLYFEDAEAGKRWYSQFYDERRNQPIYIMQDLPPEIAEGPKP